MTQLTRRTSILQDEPRRPGGRGARRAGGGAPDGGSEAEPRRRHGELGFVISLRAGALAPSAVQPASESPCDTRERKIARGASSGAGRTAGSEQSVEEWHGKGQARTPETCCCAGA